MSAEVDRLWGLVGPEPDAEKLHLDPMQIDQFRRNEAYGAIMTPNLRAYFMHIANERWPHYYQSFLGSTHDRTKIRAIVAPYCYFRDDIEDPDQREYLVRALVTKETCDEDDEQVLDCSDFAVNTKSNTMSVRRAIFRPTPSVANPNMLYWPSHKDHLPKIFSDIRDDEVNTTVTIVTGAAYEKASPNIKDFLKVKAAQTFSEYAAYLSLGNELQLARDVIFSTAR